ncbi:MAG: DUF2062 domain-containing protein [Altererythrobacter sp.]|uniref:DUF2062 domain-containing protein n=1 Tax=uncultured Altererythrobacter sp. TaxID=500840 RepID=UPI0018423CEE|nr:DUF2062 domain-containing protein [uncultured Altererythrobacter sp.]MBT8388111.1 DUF2062 domain-containing protein [Altererythrobacter sp.]MBT8431219.1 DUF2062 domain-containing protein [Altererythrobacter sp.]NNE48711.1 DUF2062 domain-containing protein [Altererythrobacter sp.]NNF94954.1 DUF2062 domain-containing protein [Altererythrobacter sp.]NNK46651.1 DUF2062 domain-containing protein [Altererythrobacter sp.]
MATRSKTWLADKLKAYFPKREELARNRYLAPIAHRFLSPELWRFTRRSVPRGVALGLFAAFIVPIGQIFLAAFLALPVRANMPLAAAVTFVTNPFTLPFWLVIANRVGNFTLAVDAATTGVATEGMATGQFAWLAEFWQLAGVTAFGFVVLAVVSAAIGYLVASGTWRVMVARRRTKRLRRMEARLDERLGAQQG